MSEKAVYDRLALALIDHIADLSGRAKFLLLEGIPEDLAQSLAENWTLALPPLRIGSNSSSHNFLQYQVKNQSFTYYRNQSATGLCAVICPGYEVPDWQSISRFANLAVSDLLTNSDDLNRILHAKPSIDAVEEVLRVKQAIQQVNPRYRPTPYQFASYLNRLANGVDALADLPSLGAFRDETQNSAFTSQRLVTNFKIAKDCFDIPTKESNAIRALANRVFLKAPEKHRNASEFMELLGSGNSLIFSYISFDEAQIIFDNQRATLLEKVRGELGDFRNTANGASINKLAWNRIDEVALSLSTASLRIRASSILLAFDDECRKAVFTKPVRKRLEKLLQPRTVKSHTDSLYEALGDAFSRLDTAVSTIEVVSPVLTGADSRSESERVISLSAMQLWLKSYVDLVLIPRGINVIGQLLLSPSHILGTNYEDHISHLPSPVAEDSESVLPIVEIRVHGETDADVVDVRWKPGWDDVALLTSAYNYIEHDSTYLIIDSEPNASSIALCKVFSEPQHTANAESVITALKTVSAELLDHGISAKALLEWNASWGLALNANTGTSDTALLKCLCYAGGFAGPNGLIGLGPLSPSKAEWLHELVDESWRLMNRLIDAHHDEAAEEVEASLYTLNAMGGLTSTHLPAFIRVPGSDDCLLPVDETRLWSVYSYEYQPRADYYAAEAVERVLKRLITLRPEAASHLKCLAFGSTAATTLLRVLLRVMTSRDLEADDSAIDLRRLSNAELLCVGGRPTHDALSSLEKQIGDLNRDRFSIKYFSDVAELKMAVKASPKTSVAHLALVTGIVEVGRRIETNIIDVEVPKVGNYVLFAPRTTTRPGQQQRLLLMPSSPSALTMDWLKLMSAIDDGWDATDSVLRVPELRFSNADIRHHLEASHDLALWVATVDRYVSRDSLHRSLGNEIAILHQETRLSPSSPLALVISQKSSAAVDRAITRSLTSAKIVSGKTSAELGKKLREVATQGYGILALEAATSGNGINELVGHVVSFSLLGTTATPWPLPPGCRVLLVSLDEYEDWFRGGKRADFLAVAIDTKNIGLHIAVVEVKARRSDEVVATSDAVEQIRNTLRVTKYALYSDAENIHCRMWLNRVTEVVYAVARETSFRLDKAEIDAIEAFRSGDGRLEWAGLGFIYGPNVEPKEQHYSEQIFGDRIPIKVQSFRLTHELLQAAVGTKTSDLRTVEVLSVPLGSSRIKRRPELPPIVSEQPEASSALRSVEVENLGYEAKVVAEDNSSVTATNEQPVLLDQYGLQFEPILGWIAGSGRALRWSVAGANAKLPNGHVEIWGSSGSGKTQFIQSLLFQTSYGGARCAILDFKNDYGEDFPKTIGAEFYDLWRGGVPYNPLALDSRDARSIASAIIEIRDTVKVATQAYMSMGHRQLDRLSTALKDAYGLKEDPLWPTLLDVDLLLDPELRAAIGDLTHHEMFKQGPSLGSTLNLNIVFSMAGIPGSGLTTVLAGGFILTALLFKIQALRPVSNTVTSLIVVDEAHRVSSFKAVDTMIREGRSKGLSVVLATQQPNDLPEVVGANAQTRICFRLPDATMARAAAKRLDQSDKDLPERIRTLAVGEAFVSLGGSVPYQVNMAQLWRDRTLLTRD